MTDEEVARLWAKIDKDGGGGCWQWTGALTGHGYGHMQVFAADGRRTWPPAHRLVYELEVGPIPKGLMLDHLCRNRGCVNPKHLEPVTCSENLQRGEMKYNNGNAYKTHCPKCGGDYTTWQGRRYCLSCRNEQRRARREGVELS